MKWINRLDHELKKSMTELCARMEKWNGVSTSMSTQRRLQWRTSPGRTPGNGLHTCLATWGSIINSFLWNQSTKIRKLIIIALTISTISEIEQLHLLANWISSVAYTKFVLFQKRICEESKSCVWNSCLKLKQLFERKLSHNEFGSQQSQ